MLYYSSWIMHEHSPSLFIPNVTRAALSVVLMFVMKYDFSFERAPMYISHHYVSVVIHGSYDPLDERKGIMGRNRQSFSEPVVSRNVDIHQFPAKWL